MHNTGCSCSLAREHGDGKIMIFWYLPKVMHFHKTVMHACVVACITDHALPCRDNTMKML